MAYNPNLPSGQATMANSAPVVVASDQSSIPVSQGTATNLKTQAENYQGGTAVGAGNPLQVTLANTGANATAVKVDGSAVTQPVSGTVTANAGTNLNTSALALETGGNLASVKTNTDNLNLAQASTTSGQKGNLVMGAVTTSSPTYTTAQTNPISLTTAGAIRTDSSATTQPVSGTVAVSTINSVAPAFGSGVRGATVQRVTIATDDVVPASQSGTWTVQPGNTANTTPWLVTDTPATSGGLSKFHLVSAASTNATNIKASAGQIYSITAFNINASPRYVKFHNTSGTPTAGSGVTESFMIPGNTTGAGFVINFDKGIAFGTGIGITLTTGITDADTTAVAANEILVNVYYK